MADAAAALHLAGDAKRREGRLDPLEHVVVVSGDGNERDGGVGIGGGCEGCLFLEPPSAPAVTNSAKL